MDLSKHWLQVSGCYAKFKKIAWESFSQARQHQPIIVFVDESFARFLSRGWETRLVAPWFRIEKGI